jgi:hypothetical protein
MKRQKGFAHLEALLLLVLVAMIGGTLWYVWHSKQQANNLYGNLSTPTINNKKKAPAKSTAKPKTVPKVVSFTSASNANGATVQSDADIDKLDGAPDSFKDFLKDKFDKNKGEPSPCGNAYGLFVKKIYQENFALGGESHCKHTDKLWVKVSDQWSEVGSTDGDFNCSILEQYKVPSAIVEHCMKNGQLVDNSVSDQ